MEEWITNNFNKLKEVCSTIAGENCDDLFQSCMEQLLKNKKFNEIEDKDKIFYFTRLVLNNYNSKTSRYYYENKKVIFCEYLEPDIQEEEYKEERFDMRWVHSKLSKLKVEQWYFARLFEIYIEENCSITKLSKRTTIPINTCSRDIKKIRTLLINERKKEINFV